MFCVFSFGKLSGNSDDEKSIECFNLLSVAITTMKQDD